MDEKMIPYFSHEGDMARMERTNKRLFILLIIMIVAFVLSNAYWIYRESQFQVIEEKTEIEAKQDGSAINIIGGGDVNYGADSKDN